MRLTQHAVSTVLPSVGITYGFRKVASRVSPSGNSLTLPSGTQERYASARPRVIDERRYCTIGTANVVATNPLTNIPILVKNPRRESVVSFDIVRLLVLRVRSGIGLPGVLCSARNQPGDNVRDFLVCHRLAGHVSAPVGRTQFRAAGYDNRAQSLIAHQRQK